MKNLFLSLSFALLVVGCQQKELIETSPDAQLIFSSDSISFDTVFTDTESTFRTLKVFNPYDKAVILDEVRLQDGGSSPFKININGQPVNAASNLKIAAKDSLYIFIKVNINGNASDLPFVTEDAISFILNNKTISIPLLAYGQNVIRLNEQTLSVNTIFSNNKPYVIKGKLTVAEGATLSIEPGSRLYFHQDAQLVVEGELDAQGSLSDKIIFCSDRLEKTYIDEPGQWKGIWLTRKSSHSQLNHCLIKNAVIGIQADSLGDVGSEKLLLSNCIVKNHQVGGLITYHSQVTAINNLFTNCGQYLFAGLNGGNLLFLQNTFAAYNYSFARSTPSVFISDNSIINPEVFPLEAVFYNNIIWGQADKELEIIQTGSTVFQIDFERNVIRNHVEAIGANNLYVDPLFSNSREGNFSLTANSPAQNQGRNLSALPHQDLLSEDAKGKVRYYPADLGYCERD